MSKPLDLTGQIFGRLTVVGVSHHNEKGRRFFLCRCECGKTISAIGHCLKSGNTKSCGCLAREITSNRNRTHGCSKASELWPEYRSWSGIIQRCTNRKNPAWVHYGARGIKVCERWLVFENFLADMGQRPSSNHSIDRINNDGDYCKENCRWATRKEQNRNRRDNIYIKFDGVYLTLADWESLLGLTTGLLKGRVHKRWSVNKTLFHPRMRIIKRKDSNEKTTLPPTQIPNPSP